MSKPPSDAAATLSAETFIAIYDAELDYVWHTLRRLGVPERDRDDLCHDVFVVLYRSRYDARRPIRPWLFGIAFRVASDYRRRARHRYEVASDHDRADSGPGAEDRLALRERFERVGRALDALDLDRRAVFVMHDIDGHTMPEIAAVLGVPLNTCYSRLRLARQDFAHALHRQMGPEEKS